jgi:hypothetical protein
MLKTKTKYIASNFLNLSVYFEDHKKEFDMAGVSKEL